jgi:hypothetical protein
MVQFLAQAAGGLVLVLVVGWWRVRAGRRRRSALGHGDAVLVGARVGLGTGKLRAGKLVLSPSRIVWTRRGRTVDLAGAQVLASAQAPGNYGANGFVRVRLRLAGGSQAQVQVHREDAATLVGLLQSDVPPAPDTGPPAGTGWIRSGWWAIACLVLGLGWLAANVIAGLDGDSVQAHITRAADGDGYCRVAWVDADGATHRGEVACDNERPGARIGLRVFGWPDAGDPWAVSDAVGMVGATSTPLVLIGGGGLLYLRGRRRAWAAVGESAPRALVTDPCLPALQDDDLRTAAGESPAALLARVAPYARRQVPEDGWEEPKRPSGPRGPWAPARLGRALCGPAVALAVVAAITLPMPYQWFLLHRSATATAVATSSGDVTAEGWGPLPDQVTLRFRDARGSSHLADVATVRPLPRGARAQIAYVVDRPGWAQVVGPADGLDRGAALAGGGAALALLWAGWAIRSLGRAGRAIRQVAGEAPRPAVGLLTADGDGGPVVVAADPLVTPPQLVTIPLLAPLPHRTAAAFAGVPAPTLTVHGRLADGELVVVEVPGAAAPLLPRDYAAATDIAALLDLLDSAGALTRSIRGDRGLVGEAAD